MGDTEPATYLAGACNIGPAEIALRRRIGWVALVATALLLGAALWLDLSRWWRLTLALPATVSASGFLQARHHFCVGFARRGVFNFRAVGHVDAVIDESARANDRRTANRLTGFAVAIALLAAVVAVAIR